MNNQEGDFITNFVRKIGADKVFKIMMHQWGLLKNKK
ncbi:hypothetical protein Prede_2478 [Prevotella dentalis DSM 3688]|uniref:Uncharacterized protein n=1 Tax=Prevotella dentalis (strain ATCC 49559 / DSM 3688 / JCM 13448 / NCTC 12043 / ES 2772) TaxID=908937 RepID=L0JEK8_PREDD|nr:hypothetical protein Prede_2478 [Prevotella dentalis DSM 3688]